MKIYKFEEEQIMESIQSAEQKTSGQIAWAVFQRSSSYEDVPFKSGLFVAFLGVILGMVFGKIHGWGYEYALGEVFLSFILGMFLAKIPHVRRLFISKERMRRRVEERAFATFVRSNVHTTKLNNGVLIFVSMFEKMAIIVADVGANNIPDSKKVWNGMIDTILQSMKRTRLSVGIKRAILMCGDFLGKHFPRTPDTQNEIQDTLIKDSKE